MKSGIFSCVTGNAIGIFCYTKGFCKISTNSCCYKVYTNMFIIGNNIKYRDISCKTEKNMLQYKVACFVSGQKTGYCLTVRAVAKIL